MKNISSLQSAQGADIQQQGMLRGEQSGYASDYANAEGSLAGLKNNNDVSALQRQAGLVSGEAEANRGWDVADLQTANAQQQAKLGMITAPISMAGSIFGWGKQRAGARKHAERGGTYWKPIPGQRAQFRVNVAVRQHVE
jgi:hypothetical protein